MGEEAPSPRPAMALQWVESSDFDDGLTPARVLLHGTGVEI